MIYKEEEFAKIDNWSTSMLSVFRKAKEPIHEMGIDKIKSVLLKGAYSNILNRKKALDYYLRWLNDNCPELDVSDLYYDVKNLDVEGNADCYVRSIDEVINLVNEAINTADTQGSADLYGAACCYILSWYGITNDEYMTIKLSDVHENSIYISLTDRTVEIPDFCAMNFVREYRDKDGTTITNKFCSKGEMVSKERFVTYVHDTLFRTTKDVEITKLLLYNHLNRLIKYLSPSDAIKFKDNRVFYSGRYKALYDMEREHGEWHYVNDLDFLNRHFSTNVKASQMYKRLEEYKDYTKNIK